LATAEANIATNWQQPKQTLQPIGNSGSEHCNQLATAEANIATNWQQRKRTLQPIGTTKASDNSALLAVSALGNFG